LSSIAKQLALPVRAYFNPRFEAIAELVRSRSDAVQRQLDQLTASSERAAAEYEGLVQALGKVADRPQGAGGLSGLGPVGLVGLLGEHAEGSELERQAALLARVDVAAHNTGPRPGFDTLVSQAAAAADFSHPAFISWAGQVHPHERDQVPSFFHRKLWEWVYIVEAVKQSGCLRPGAQALGFGVGNEPVPAMLAAHGVKVLATDQDVATSGLWSETGQHLGGLHDLLRPAILPDDELAALVDVRAVDMNDPLDDLGTYDVIWSSCALEHLGSPAAGLDFVVRSAALLAPGGVAVHTTELELTSRDESAEYGNCAVYRREELLEVAERLRAEGYEIEVNPYVSLDTVAERWVSQALARNDGHDVAHLRLQIGDSISTSFGLLVRRPA
jgi:hypothetical protein